MDKNTKKYLLTSFIFLLIAGIFELVILGVTKATNFDHSNGRPLILAFHVHALVLGFIFSLILALLENAFHFSNNKLAKIGYYFHLIGLGITLSLILYKGFAQLLNFETLVALTDGGAAIGHTLVLVGLILYIIPLLKLKKDN